MASNQLTMMDVIPDPAQQALVFDQLDQNRMQNRLAHMAMQDMMQDREVNRIMAEMGQVQGMIPSARPGSAAPPVQQGQMPTAGEIPTDPMIIPPQVGETVQQPRPIQPTYPQPTPTMDPYQQVINRDPRLLEAVERRRAADQARQQAQLKAALDNVEKVHKINPAAAAQMVNNNPMLLRAMGGPISIERREGEANEVKAGGKVLGHSVRMPDGKYKFVAVGKEEKEPISTEANYRIGLEEQIREKHPEWSKKRVAFEAAKQVREENVLAAQNKIQFGVTLRETAKIADEERKELKSFKGWKPDEKENQFWSTLITGKDPKFSWGDKNSYTRYNQERNRWEIDNGVTPGLKMRVQSDYKALDKSTSNQRKIYDMMAGFADNIKLQVGKVEEIYKKLPRTQLKLLNVPIKELRVRALGSGEEAAAASYLLEISNEIGKLSTGSAASIRELSESAQEKWTKVHDGTLPFKDLQTVLKTTLEQADMRIVTAKIAMDYTRQAIEEISTKPVVVGAGVPPPGVHTNLKPFDITRKPGETIAQFLERAKRGGK